MITLFDFQAIMTANERQCCFGFSTGIGNQDDNDSSIGARL